MLLAALLVLGSSPDFMVSLVGSDSGRCVYWTGDVGLNADQFREQLIGAAERYRGLVIYRSPGTPRRCLNRARQIARGVGFREIRVELPPSNLYMGPMH